VTAADGTRAANITFAVLGTVLLVLGGAVVFTLGVLTDFFTDLCGVGDFESRGVIHCGNSGPAKLILMTTPLVVTPAAVLLTWFRPRGNPPRGWAPFAGLAVVTAAWLFVAEVVPVI
jgi:hypothetical protein